MRWKYVNSDNKIVYRTYDDGSMESCIVEAIADWIAENGEPDPADPVIPEIPIEVSMRQARLALYQQGLLNQVQLAIDNLPEPQKTITQITWDYATVVNRKDALVAGLSLQLGLDSATLDALFTLASTL